MSSSDAAPGASLRDSRPAAALAGVARRLRLPSARRRHVHVLDALHQRAGRNTPFAAELKRTLDGGGSTTLVDTAAAAQAILDVTNVVDDKQVLSLSGGGRVREYLLTKRAQRFRCTTPPARTGCRRPKSSIRRSYTFNESEVLAREAEEERLLKDMQTDAVQQIVRRLQAAKKPA